VHYANLNISHPSTYCQDFCVAKWVKMAIIIVIALVDG